MTQRRMVIAAVGAASAAGLAFEITLTRLFSLFFQYHYTFLAVSLATMGLSLGAALGQLVSPPPSESSMYRRLIILLCGLSLSFSLVTIVAAWLPSASTVWPRALVALIPYLLIGVFFALVFERFSSFSGTLYGADLVGAAVGVVAVLALLGVWSAFSMTLFLAVLIAFIALALARVRADDKGLFVRVGGVAAITVVLFAVNLLSGVFDFDPERLDDPPRDKTMLFILDDPAQDARIVRTEWSPFAQVDVVETNDPSVKYIFADGGAGSYMLQYDGNLDTLNYLRDTVEYLPFSVAPAEQTLILGAGGGKDILLALLAGADAITAIEVNPAIVHATRAYADYNGNVLDLPQVTLAEGDARVFVERDNANYDLIYLNLVYTQAAEPASQALVENYIFTWQAFAAYLDRLKPSGHLAVVSHNALEGSRAALTALRALDERGIEPAQGLDYLALWMLPADDPTQRMSVLLVGSEPLHADTLDGLRAGALQQGMSPLFTPGDYELPLEPLRGGMSLHRFANDEKAEYNLAPTDDDQPYFFHLDRGLPRPMQSALVTSTILAGGLLVGSLIVSSPKQRRGMAQWAAMMGYAVLIGLGFMLVEIPLIQQFQLLLGYPILAVAVVLSALLLASGIGSLIGQRWMATSLLTRASLAGICIGILALIYRFALPGIVESALSASLGIRLLTIVSLTALIGLPMGVPFSSLLRVAGHYRQRIGLLWALNGACSVVGSALAVVISMTWGFSWALTFGAVLYILFAAWAQGMRSYTT